MVLLNNQEAGWSTFIICLRNGTFPPHFHEKTYLFGLIYMRVDKKKKKKKDTCCASDIPQWLSTI